MEQKTRAHIAPLLSEQVETLHRELFDAQKVIQTLLARIEALERDTASLETALSEHQHDRGNQAVWPV